MGDEVNTDPPPRGAARRQRFYLDHARENEALFVAILPNGNLAKINGRVAVSTSPTGLEALELQASRPNAPRWVYESRALPLGTRIHRV